MNLPLAHLETSRMFCGQARKQISVLGALVAQNRGGAKGTTTQNILLVIKVLDHTCLGAAALMEQVAGEIDGIRDVKCVHFWCDCGPHFRAYDFLGCIYKQWVERYALRLLM